MSKGGETVLEHLKSCVIVCGHYGAGKTNLTVNLALAAAQSGEAVSVIDMDVVNPYFRTADFQELFREAGIRLIAPIYANTNLDLPVLPPSVGAAIREKTGRLFLDVGGDDDGAVALGGFSALLEERGYSMLYVVNSRRELEPEPGEEAALLRRIQTASRLKVTHLVNNTNLGPETTSEVLLQSLPYLEEVSKRTGVPVLGAAAEERLAPHLEAEGLLPVRVYVKPPWS